MAVPRRRHSKSRKNKRRAQWKLTPPNIVVCPRCHEPRLPHRVCPHCGFYKDREVLQLEKD